MTTSILSVRTTGRLGALLASALFCLGAGAEFVLPASNGGSLALGMASAVLVLVATLGWGLHLARADRHYYRDLEATLGLPQLRTPAR